MTIPAKDRPKKTGMRMTPADSESSSHTGSLVTRESHQDSVAETSTTTTTTIDMTSAQAMITDRLRRETDLAMDFAQQLQARSQVVASTLTLVVTVIGVVLGANSSFLVAIQRENLVPHAVTILALLGLALVLSLGAAYPTALRFTSPSWYRDMLERDAIAIEVPAGEGREILTPLRRPLDETEVALFEAALSANRWRGRLLAGSLIAIMGVVVSIIWMVIDASVS